MTHPAESSSKVGLSLGRRLTSKMSCKRPAGQFWPFAGRISHARPFRRLSARSLSLGPLARSRWPVELGTAPPRQRRGWPLYLFLYPTIQNPGPFEPVGICRFRRSDPRALWAALAAIPTRCHTFRGRPWPWSLAPPSFPSQKTQKGPSLLPFLGPRPRPRFPVVRLWPDVFRIFPDLEALTIQCFHASARRFRGIYP